MTAVQDIAEGIDEARDFVRVALMACSALPEDHGRYAIKRALDQAIAVLDSTEHGLSELKLVRGRHDRRSALMGARHGLAGAAALVGRELPSGEVGSAWRKGDEDHAGD